MCLHFYLKAIEYYHLGNRSDSPTTLGPIRSEYLLYNSTSFNSTGAASEFVLLYSIRVLLVVVLVYYY